MLERVHLLAVQEIAKALDSDVSQAVEKGSEAQVNVHLDAAIRQLQALKEIREASLAAFERHGVNDVWPHDLNLELRLVRISDAPVAETSNVAPILPEMVFEDLHTPETPQLPDI